MHPPRIPSGHLPPSRRQLRGFTAIELMVTVAIVAVLAALAAPSFIGLMERWRVQQAAEDLTSTFYYARSEAIKRGGTVVLRKNPQGTDGCQQAGPTQEWGCGWFVFVDTNGNGSRQDSEELLQTTAPPNKLDVVMDPSGNFVRFDRYGISGTGGRRFTISPARVGVASPNTRTLCISSGGRIRTIQGDVTCV